MVEIADEVEAKEGGKIMMMMMMVMMADTDPAW